MELSPDPGVIAALLIAGGLYVRAVRVLRRRGVGVSGTQQAAWYGGLALLAAGLLSPVDPLGEELLVAHMGQHVLIADLAAPLLLAGLRTPVLQFLLPRAALVPLARRGGLRRALTALRRPLVAVPVFVLVLYAWHLPVLFEAALRSDALHALQHSSLIAVSVLVWWAPLEPDRRRLRGELWKAGQVMGARAGGMMLGMAFVALRAPAYGEAYGDAAATHGLTALQDQQIAGALMMSFDLAVMLAAFGFFFWRAGRDHDLDAGAEAPPPARAPAPPAGRAA